MSVSKINNLLSNKGCTVLVSVLTLIGVAGGIGYGSCSRGMGSGRDSEQTAIRQDNSPVLLDAGDFKLTSEQLNASLQQFSQSGQSLSPDLVGFMISNEMQNAYAQAIFAKLIKDSGVTVPTSELRAAVEQQIDSQIMDVKSQLVSRGMLKASATEKEFTEAALQAGIDLEDIKKRRPEIVEQVLKDPAKSGQIRVQVGMKALQEKYAAAINPTDEEVKRGLDGIVAKRILLTAEKAGASPIKTLSDKVLTDLRQGMTFEAAMDKYTADVAAPGKKAHDNELNLTRNMLQEPVKSALGKLKPGEVTGALEVPEGIVIIKLVKVLPNVPKDFDKQKEQLKKDFAANQAQSRLSSEVQALRTQSEIKWNSPSAQALYDLGQAYQTSDSKARLEKFKSMLAMVKADQPDDEGLRRLNAIARFRVVQAIEQSKTPGSADIVAAEKVDAIEAMVQFFDDTQLRIDLAKLLLERKDKRAFDSLKIAAERNISELDSLSKAVSVRNDVDALAAKLTAAGLMSPEQKVVLDRIQKDFDEAKKLAVERQKKDDEEKRKAAEEQRKAEEQKKKDAQQAKPTPSARPLKPTPSPSASGH